MEDCSCDKQHPHSFSEEFSIIRRQYAEEHVDMIDRIMNTQALTEDERKSMVIMILLDNVVTLKRISGNQFKEMIEAAEEKADLMEAHDGEDDHAKVQILKRMLNILPAPIRAQLVSKLPEELKSKIA